MTTKAPKKKQPKQQPKRKQNLKNAKNLTMFLPVSHCATHYAAVLSLPFDAEHGACVPAELFPLPSQKVTVTTRGTFALGTSGFGYVEMSPCVVNDQTAVGFSTATSVGTSSTTFGTYTNLGSQNFTGLPYASASLTSNSVQARIVGYGLRARYAGSLMNRNGTAFIYEEPDHQNLNTISFDTIASYGAAKQIDVTNWTPHGIEDNWMASLSCSGPVTPADVEFQNVARPFGDNVSMIAVSGSPGDKWAFEAIIHL